MTVSPTNTSQVTFSVDAQGVLSATINTARLHLRSITEQDLTASFELFNDPEVMKHYASGQVKTAEKIRANVKKWVQRWQENDPYSTLAIFTKTDEFVGMTILDHGHIPGQVELSYLLKKQYWGCGFATEVATAMVHVYAPATRRAGYVSGVENSPDEVAEPIDLIIATARCDNPQSGRVVEKVGMQRYMIEHAVWREENLRAWRYRYVISIDEILQERYKRLTSSNS